MWKREVLIKAGFLFCCICFLFSFRSFPTSSEHENIIHHENFISFTEVSFIASSYQSRPFLFVHSSFETKLPPFLICSIESTALLHPDSPVFLFSETLGDDLLLFLNFHNVYVVHFLWPELFGHSELGLWYSELPQTYSNKAADLSDAFRFSSLHQFGGVYQDLDSVPIRNLNNLSNVVPTEGCFKGSPITSLNNIPVTYQYTQASNNYCPEGWQLHPVTGILIMDKDNPILTAVIDNSRLLWKKNFWGSIGPWALHKVVYLESGEYNSAITLAPPSAFLPIMYEETDKFVSPNTWTLYQGFFSLNESSTVYTFHWYQSVQKQSCKLLGRHTLVEEIMFNHCPLTLNLHYTECANR
eukprot:GCRY01001842.1.p1 GENE.GCRY01001842.1~~GCRY01001842.1.p1  ORF type:complete len:356 (+),score=8.59 GCRY01001842.1:234-1301(+)